MKTVHIIGAGAAGCFCAIELRRRHPDWDVTVFEAGPKPLAKLALTGGGHCNITNDFSAVEDLKSVYPRGFRLMKRCLSEFGPEAAIAWWEKEGLPLAIRESGRIFPVSMDAMDVVRTLERLMREVGVKLRCRSRVDRILIEGSRFSVVPGESADIVVVTSGGAALRMLPPEVETVPCVPSLYGFRTAGVQANVSSLHSLAGISVRGTVLKLAGTSITASGDLLLTDWGISGPAVLRMSSYAARELASGGFKGRISVNWTGLNEEDARSMVRQLLLANPRRELANVHPDGIPSRLWACLLDRAGLGSEAGSRALETGSRCAGAGLRCSEVGTKVINRITAVLVSDMIEITGRCPYKEEFVTCGGVALSGVKSENLESKTIPGLFFAGEVLDIDAVTGGFNLQVAWSTAMKVARNL